MHYKIHLDSQKIQSFLACVSFIEKHQDDCTFELENSNNEIDLRISELFPGIILKGTHGTSVEITTDHSQPFTEIGAYSASLLFPRLVTNFYAKKNKINKVYFKGLITTKRFKYIFKSVKMIDGIECLSLLKLLFTSKVETSSFCILKSERGRLSNTKYWDEKYYSELARYKFILCPPGDFDWTYRYYESILVGGIPCSLSMNEKAYPYGIRLINRGFIDRYDGKTEDYIDFDRCVKECFI